MDGDWIFHKILTNSKESDSRPFITHIFKMTENTENTLTAYLGPEFQQRLMWQLLVEPEFAEKIIPDLAIEYFDDPNLRRLFIIILEYYNEFDKVPNLQNQSIHQAINKYKTPNNVIEEESLFAVIKRVTLWNERVINKQMHYDGDVVQKSAHAFVKQQEYRKIAEHIQEKVKSGGIKDKFVVAAIEDKFQKIAHIGEEDDDSESLTEGVSKALRKEFRETIPTGIGTIDELTGGGLGKGEIGVILTPSGVGKTTALTIIANTAYEQEKNVAQIIFEDTKDQIKRKHYTIWAKSALSRLNEDEENERVTKVVNEKIKRLEGRGRLIIKRFSQEDTTMKDVRNWMLSYQKKWGFKFDILVLDYLDCLESHKTRQDRTESELTIIKGFESLASDFDIPAWTAIQSNRSGFGAEFVEAYQSGGSIKRVQKAHFFMSVAKTPAQQEANFANIRIIKARFAKDGQAFEDCVFNNDTMQIIIDDPRYRHTKNYKNIKHHDETDIEKLEKKATGLSQMHVAISEKTLVEKVNDDSINDGRTEAQRVNDLLHQNKQPEANDDITPNDGFEATSDERKMEMPEKIELHPDVENIHISTSRTDLSQEEQNKVFEIVNEVMEESQNNGVTEEILELDGEVTDAPSEGANEGVTEGANADLLDFSGDTVTKTVSEPQEVPTPEERKELDKGWEELRDSGLDKPFKPPTVAEELKVINKDADEILRLIQETDPDEPEGKDKTFNNFLIKKRDYQKVKPKD